jgi:hypothetical protein
MRTQWTLGGAVAVGTIGQITWKDNAGDRMPGSRIDFSTGSDYFNTGEQGFCLVPIAGSECEEQQVLWTCHCSARAPSARNNGTCGLARQAN